MVVMVECPRDRLPQEISSEKYGPIGAGKLIYPILPLKRPPIALRVAPQANATGLARPHPARHRALHRHLAFDPPRTSDLGHPLHHPLRPTGINHRPPPLPAIQVTLQCLRNETAKPIRSIIGGN